MGNQRSHRRAVFFALFGLSVLPVLLTYWMSDASFGLRVGLAHLRGYDGCTCGDCADAHGFGPAPPDIRCGTFQLHRRAAVRDSLFASSLPLSLFLVVAGVARRVKAKGNPLVCAKCAYDLRGLPGPCCPECGETLEPAAPARPDS